MLDHPQFSHNRRRTDDWFRILVEAMGQGLGILDEKGILRYVNPEFCKMMGYRAEELTGRALVDSGLFDEKNLALVRRHLEGHERGEFEQYELGFTRKDGSKLISIVSPRPLLGEGGQLQGYFAIVTDITSRKQAEEHILKLSAVVEQSPIGVMITDKAGNIEYVNPRFSELTGYSEAELIGKNPRIIQSGRTPKETYQDLWDTVLHGREWRGELQDRRKDGEIYWADEIVFSIKDARSEVAHLVALQEDITARKKAEQSLMESEAKYSLLVESSLTGIYIVQDGRLVYVNRKFIDDFEYSKEELTGMVISRLIHPEDRARSAELSAKMLGSEDALENDVVRGITKSGEIMTFKKSCARIVYQNQPAILGNIVNISQEKRMQQQLLEYAGQLRLLSEKLLAVQEEERKRVASDLHDGIGQYLSALKLGLQRASPETCQAETEEGRSPPCLQLVPVIQEAIEEVRRITADLRPGILDDLGILATINWLCRRFQILHDATHIDTHIELQESEIPEPLKIVIFRLLQESLNNAVKHANARLVSVWLAKTDDGIALTVSDNGSGFDTVQVLKNESTDRGFGLISMRERVKLSGGRFTIESFPGKGTTISALWPLSQD